MYRITLAVGLDQPKAPAWVDREAVRHGRTVGPRCADDKRWRDAMMRGQMIRQALMVAKPWQRYLICAAMIVGGIGLVATGHLGGIVLAALGLVIGVRMLQYRVQKIRKSHHVDDNQTKPAEQ